MLYRFCVISPKTLRNMVRFVMHVTRSGPWAIMVQRRQKWPESLSFYVINLFLTDIGFWVHNTAEFMENASIHKKSHKKKWRALRTLMSSTALTMMIMFNFFFLPYRYQWSTFAFKFLLIFNMRLFFYLEKKEYFVTCITWKNVFFKRQWNFLYFLNDKKNCWCASITSCSLYWSLI